MQPSTPLRPTLVCLAGLLLCVEVSGQAKPDPVKRLPLSKKLSWISSAAWVDSLNGSVVIAPLLNKLLLVSPEGQVTTPPQPRPKEGDFLPASIAPLETGGFLLKLVGSESLELDNRLGQIETPSISDFRQASKGVLGSLYEWTIAGPNIVGYGAVRSASDPEKFDRGFVVAPLRDLSKARLLAESPESKFYRLGHSYFTNIGQSAYYIELGTQQPSIQEVQVDGKTRFVGGLPGVFSKSVTLETEIVGPQSDEPLFQEIERKALPVGLFGFDKNLYLLGRSPKQTPEAGTRWLLYRIDPSTGEASDPTEIRSAAHHLTVVVGTRDWYIFEKGRVMSSGEQDISSMLVVSGNWISSLGKTK